MTASDDPFAAARAEVAWIVAGLDAMARLCAELRTLGLPPPRGGVRHWSDGRRTIDLDWWTPRGGARSCGVHAALDEAGVRWTWHLGRSSAEAEITGSCMRACDRVPLALRDFLREHAVAFRERL